MPEPTASEHLSFHFLKTILPWETKEKGAQGGYRKQKTQGVLAPCVPLSGSASSYSLTLGITHQTIQETIVDVYVPL